jgi:phage shock protein C
MVRGRAGDDHERMETRDHATTITDTTRELRRVKRSRDDRMISGVCGGIARYFGIDPVIVRVATIALVAAGGVGAVTYVAAWILMPLEDLPAAPAATSASAPSAPHAAAA